jgi:CheY-like chemotaxis protein
MPGHDGFYVMEEMEKDPQLAGIPIVLLTATTFAETALMQRDSSIAIRRQGGLSPAEVLRCLHAVVPVLQPRYDERSVPEETGLPSAALAAPA